MSYRIISTVITAASSQQLASLADVKAELGIVDTLQDQVLTRYIDLCSAAAAQFCDRVFPKETVKDEIWPEYRAGDHVLTTGLKAIQLSRWPVISVTAITENGSVLAEEYDYRVDMVSGLAHRLNEHGHSRDWPAWPLSVTYQAGYETVPADVQDAVIRMVKARHIARGRDPFLRSESIPGVRDATWWIPTGADAGNMPPDVVDILSNYRQPVVR